MAGGHDEGSLDNRQDEEAGQGERVQHAWDDPIWGTGIPPAGLEERGGEEQDLELIGDRLRASGIADLGRFHRLTDYVNMLQGFFTLRAVTLLDRTGQPTRLTMPELRVRLDDVAVIAQRRAEQVPGTDPAMLVEKVQQRLVIMTPAHIVAGDVHVHAGGSILHFVDSTDPRFIPMSDVRVRWLDDRALVGHFPFALVHRTRILGVATEGLGTIEVPSPAGDGEAAARPDEDATEDVL